MSCHGGDQKSLESVVMEMLFKFDSHDSEKTEDTRNAINQAYTLTGKAKLEGIKDYVVELLQNGIKVLVFAHHKAILDGL